MGPNNTEPSIITELIYSSIQILIIIYRLRCQNFQTTYKHLLFYKQYLKYIKSGGTYEGTVSSSRKTAAN